jgi:hypothetical protein
MLDLATWSDQFILILANQPVASDRLKIAHVANRADVAPSALDAKEACQQELIGYIGQNAADVDVGKTSRFHRPTERTSQYTTAVSEVATGVAIGPSCFKQQFLQSNASSETPMSQIQSLGAGIAGSIQTC